MKDSYRDAYGTAIIYAHAKELEEGTVTVEELITLRVRWSWRRNI